MKVKELISHLQSVNPELEVVLSRDANGSEFSPYADFRIGEYDGKFHEAGRDDDDAYEVDSVVLWPRE